MSGSRDPD